jgi:sugar-specific transcriptional regulator TrmB
MNIQKSLEDIGLSSNEITIYTYLLRQGNSSGRNIVIATNLDKSSVYRALSELQKKRLVNSLGEARNQLFQISDTFHLLDLVRKKEEEINEVKKNVESLITDIQAYAKNSYKSLNIHVFEGSTGYKTWLEERLNGNVKLIREIIPQKYQIHFDNYYEYMDAYITRRKQKGIQLRTLNDSKGKNDHLDRMRKDILKEARNFPGELHFDAALSTFGNKTAFYTDKRGNFMGIILEDVLISRLINSLFDYIWSQSKAVD